MAWKPEGRSCRRSTAEARSGVAVGRAVAVALGLVGLGGATVGVRDAGDEEGEGVDVDVGVAGPESREHPTDKVAVNSSAMKALLR